ncbi:hypothetical protein [Solibacillus sp. NPDC093137]|uniref:hypothetical protein n=1 Tax=Solibacillus sp. NPDC093137 TaxID=3390678 RepID=UPI003D00C661
MVMGFFRNKKDNEEKPVRQNVIATEPFVEQEDSPPVGNPTDLSLPEKKIPMTRPVQSSKQKRTLSDTVTFNDEKTKREPASPIHSQSKTVQSTVPAKSEGSVLTEQQQDVLENARKVFLNSHVTESKPDLERNIAEDALEEDNPKIPDVVQVNQNYIDKEEEFYRPKREEKNLPEHVEVEEIVVPTEPERPVVVKAMADDAALERNLEIFEKDIVFEEDSAAPIRMIELEEDIEESELEAIRRAEEEENRELARLKLSEQSMKSEGHHTSVTIVYSKESRVNERTYYFPIAHNDFIDSYALEVETIGHFTAKDIYGNLITINPSKLHTIEIKNSQNSLLD